MNIKDMIKKNLLTILSAVALLSMLFTFVSFTAETEFSASAIKLTGIQACGKSMFAYLLIIGPVLLIAMNYIKSLEKYKGLLSISVPCVCLIALIIVCLNAKTAAQAVGGAVEGVTDLVDIEMDISQSIGFGAILAAISYISMIVFGIKTQRDFSISKLNVGNLGNINIDNIKATGADLIKSAQNTVAKAAQNISENIPTSTGTSKKHIDDTLSLIEKLAKMKDDGILTEQEFANKKSKLLEDI